MGLLNNFFDNIFHKDVYSFIKNNLVNTLLTPLTELNFMGRFNFLFFNRRNYPIKKRINKSNPYKLIISLTSYPKRFPKLHLVLYSLLTQSLKPNKIILVLSREEVKNESELPQKILFLKKFGLEIKIISKNYRSYNKLIPALKEFPDYNIITVDDDVIYPSWFLKKLYLKHKEFPRDIICYRAHLIKITDNTIEKYLNWMRYDKNKFYSGPSIFPLGVGGVFYPPNSLNKEIFNSGVFLKICPTADDVWFKAMSLLNNTNCRRVFENKIPSAISLKGTQETALYKENVEGNKNDLQIKAVFEKYNLLNKLSI